MVAFGFSTFIPMKHFFAVCLMLLQLSLLAFIYPDGTDVEFKVKKRCHEYNLRTTTDTLKAVYNTRRRGDISALPEGVYKFAFTQCPYNRIDSVSADKGKVKFTDSVLTYDLRLYLNDTAISSVNFYVKGQLAYFKTFVLLPSASPVIQPTCNCDTGRLDFYLGNRIVNNGGVVPRQKIVQAISAGNINRDTRWIAVKRNNTDDCYEAVSCTLIYQYTDERGKHTMRTELSNYTNLNRTKLAVLNKPARTSSIKLVYRYRNSVQCNKVKRRDGPISAFKIASRPVMRQKLSFVVTN